MTEALTAAPDGPIADTLGEQVEIPKPQDNQMPQEDRPEDKTGSAVKKAMDDILGKGDDDDAEDKAEKKPDAKAKKADDLRAEKDAKAAEAKEKTDAKAEDDDADDDDAPDEDADGTQEAAKAEPKPSAYKDPPSGFDEAAKKEWETTPESVRGAMHRRAQEMERGIHKYKADADQFETVRQYADMAKESGTDLPTALNNYVTLEKALRANPMQGLQQVVANLGLKKSDGSPVTLRDVAANIMGQSPDQAASRQEATINQLTQQVQSLTHQLGGFSKHVENQQQTARTESVASEWRDFQTSNPRAAELEPQIAEFLTKYPSDTMPVRERLHDAYTWAASQNPTVAHTDDSPLAQTQPTPKQANPAGQKSISGAPSGDVRPKARNLSTSDSVKDAMRKMGI